MSVPSSSTRAQRLYNRAKDLHYEAGRLVEDLRDEEGKSEALSAQESLSSLCFVLEGHVNAGQ
jgi:hypothetical protein